MARWKGQGNLVCVAYNLRYLLRLGTGYLVLSWLLVAASGAGLFLVPLSAQYEAAFCFVAGGLVLFASIVACVIVRTVVVIGLRVLFGAGQTDALEFDLRGAETAAAVHMAVSVALGLALFGISSACVPGFSDQALPLFGALAAVSLLQHATTAMSLWLFYTGSRARALLGAGRSGV